MATVTRMLRSATCLMALCVLLPSANADSSAAAAAPNLDMVKVLQANGPHASLGDHASVLGRLVGTWDVAYADFSKNGKVTKRSGEFIVGWVLDGRAIQDVWIVDRSGTRTEREVYTDVLYFAPKPGTWLGTFFDPEHASSYRFTGSTAGDDRIVLDSHDLDAGETRWSFNDIRPDSFTFRAEEFSDGGKTWVLQSEYHMTRHRQPRPSV